MAKKLAYTYRFEPGAAGAGKLYISGHYPLKTLLLVTNVTDNQQIFNFADSDFGATTSYNATTDETTITLTYDTSSMSADDQLQIFVEGGEEKIDFSETFVDPVSKLRVSNPQNLIDTDFEYGLQPTKWETIELVNNIPSFFSAASDYILPDITSVSVVSGSESVTVKTQSNHELAIGTPIDVQGLSSRTAEGKFLITSVPDNKTFTYDARQPQSVTGTLNGSYTTIVPGQFYNNSDIKFNEDTGIKTDEGEKSALTITTDYKHGFKPGTSVYLTNTVGSEIFELTDVTNSTAPDGRPFVDNDDTLLDPVTGNSTLNETKQMTGTYALKFTSDKVNSADDTITWPDHNLYVGAVLLYVPPSGDTEVGGLERFQIYYVREVPTSDTIKLCETTSGGYNTNPVIDLTSGGTTNYGRHQLILGYEASSWGWYGDSSSSRTLGKQRINTLKDGSGTGRGQDLTPSAQFGLGGRNPDRFILCYKGNIDINLYNSYFLGTVYQTRSSDGGNANFTFGKSGTTPDGYDFIEDYERFDTGNDNGFNRISATNSDAAGGYFTAVSRSFNRGNGSSFAQQQFLTTPPSEGLAFVFLLDFDNERDTLYFEGHGLSGEGIVTLSKTAGSDPVVRTDNPTSRNSGVTTEAKSIPITSEYEVVNDNRIRINRLSTDPDRIQQLSGDYTITPNSPNPTKNSLFISDLTIPNKRELRFATGVGGSFPATATGAIIPEKDTITAVYNAVAKALNTIRSGMGTEAAEIVYNGSSDGSPITSSVVTLPSGGGLQQFSFNRTRLSVNRIIEGRSQTINASLTGSGWASGSFWDPFEATPLGGQGYYYINTPYFRNSTTNYHIDVVQIPNISILEGGLDSVSLTLQGNGRSAVVSGIRDNVTNTPKSNWETLDDGWSFTFDTNYFRPVSGRAGLINMQLIIDNDNWPGYISSWNSNINFPSGILMTPSWAGQGGQRYHIQVLIPIKAGISANNYGASGITTTNAGIASAIASEIKTTLVNPSLTAGIANTVFARVLGENRLGFETEDAVPYNFTGVGTAILKVEVPETTGALDGYYEFTGIADTTAKIFTSATVRERDLNFTATDIETYSNDNYIGIADHKLKTGQIVNYAAGSGSVGLITSGNSYHVIAHGPDNLRLAETFEDANAGNAIGIGTTSSGSFTLSSASVAGISSAQGTVAISTESKMITGTGTLFRRYFKEGDQFRIKDPTVTPPSYREYEVVSIIDDTKLTIKNDAGIGTTSTKHYIDTKVYVRPDGTSIHRPFDGGVEITAGTSPNSSIVRQTRKYFRYQSGKGIQCSLAINFNPSRLASGLQGYNNSIITSKTFNVNVYNQGSSAYIVSGNDIDGRVLGNNTPISLFVGDTINFINNSSGHPLWIKTAAGTGTGNSVTSGVINNGTDVGTIIWDTAGITTGTYYYQCQNHAAMVGEIEILDVPTPDASNSIVELSTLYPHGIKRGSNVVVKGANESTYNGTFEVVSTEDFNLKYLTDSPVSGSSPNGIIEYNIDRWSGSGVRCGLFDYQNGFFFEYDGDTLYAVRRSSVQQLAGTVSVANGSHIVSGHDTRFEGQLEEGDFVVIRGSSYRITGVDSNTQLNIQPAYQGIDAVDAVLTKTIDTKVPQTHWNIDKADGTGPSGFNLDITKIQMAYLDYSWYGAGKIRFGFKDTYGRVKYVHEFIHNNKLEEAYMRSGNIPGRYEIDNFGDSLPTFVPSLFHWGTSIIMDGKFDDDKAYLFTASSNPLSFTNGDNVTARTSAISTLAFRNTQSGRGGPLKDYYVRIPIDAADAVNFQAGTRLYTDDESTLGAYYGSPIAFVTFSGSTANLFIFIQTSSIDLPPTVYPEIPNNTVLYAGAPPSATEADVVDLTKALPVISIRLAPSVDNNLTGNLGAREIINRMQLQLRSLGITLSHDCSIDLILNGSISNKEFNNVETPSLSQLVRHVAGDEIDGGTKIFSLRASGGSENAAGKRLSSTTDFDLGDITDLGNSILGGDGAFPNGPDLLTIAITPVDTSEINASTPLTIASRITWSESQA